MVRFERSLTVDEARQSGALLAYAMNGEPLPVQHGYPVRLVVPGWYAVTSVKWLTDIEVIDTAFEGYFQSERYFYEWEREGGVIREPVSLQRVRSLICEPAAGDDVECGDLTLRGVAWSGAAPIARVEVSVDGGPWVDARLIGGQARHRWQWWELVARVERPGEVVLRARATDCDGATQPDEAEWNRLGYGANAVHSVLIHAR
jgi:DMSO/TMAO reductase YedYZ molybdopterin-dependent catalytic subunit